MPPSFDELELDSFFFAPIQILRTSILLLISDFFILIGELDEELSLNLFLLAPIQIQRTSILLLILIFYIKCTS